IQQGTFESKPAAQLLKKFKPLYWFSAYLHCKFTTLVEHEEGGPYEVQYDEEWLAITQKLNCLSFDLLTWRLWWFLQELVSRQLLFYYVGEHSSDMQEIYLVNFLKQLHLTNPLIQFQTLLFQDSLFNY
ncbi:hypothetical protein Gotur_018465, partial [Gossypium turneri]